MLLSDLKKHPSNPRHISDYELEKLKNSITNDPKFMILNPIKYDSENIIWAGNQRHLALTLLDYIEIPDEWTFKIPDYFSEEEKVRYMLIDNINSGEWDYNKLRENELFNSVDIENLIDFPEPEKVKEEEIQGQIKISTELDQESNYIVLKFNNRIDFLQIQTILGLDATFSRRANGKLWSKGIGRVVDGVDAILKIKENEN